MTTLPIELTGQLLAGAEAQVIGPATASAVTRFAPAVEVAPVGTPLVLRVQDASGASPTGYLQATIPAGAKVATPATGSFNVGAGATIYVRVVSGPTGANAASYLGGYFETTGAASGGTFCTVADLKTFAGITAATDDALLAAIIARVTGSMQKYMGRTIVETTYTAELHSLAYGTPQLVLDHRPIVSVSEVRESGTVVSAADYVLVADSGILYRETGWPSGTFHLAVDYTAGYASVPDALQGACIQQSRYVWTQAKNAGDKFGLAQRAEGGGGSTAFIVQDWYPGVEGVLRSYRRLA